jgi:hypothetical protein
MSADPPLSTASASNLFTWWLLIVYNIPSLA